MQTDNEFTRKGQRVQSRTSMTPDKARRDFHYGRQCEAIKQKDKTKVVLILNNLLSLRLDAIRDLRTDQISKFQPLYSLICIVHNVARSGFFHGFFATTPFVNCSTTST